MTKLQELRLTYFQDKEKPVAVRSSNIVAARGEQCDAAPSFTKQKLTSYQPSPMPSEHPWALEAWTR